MRTQSQNGGARFLRAGRFSIGSPEAFTRSAPIRSERPAFRRRFGRLRRGAACVEFAFAAPFIFLLVFGSIEFSRIVMVKQAMTNAAREGSRKASLINTISSTSVDATVRQALRGTIAGCNDANKVQVSVSPSTLAGLAPGTVVTTTITVSAADVSWLPAMFFSATTISTSASMQRE